MGLLMKQPQVHDHEYEYNRNENPEENGLLPIATEKGKEEYIECLQQMVLSSAFKGSSQIRINLKILTGYSLQK